MIRIIWIVVGLLAGAVVTPYISGCCMNPAARPIRTGPYVLGGTVGPVAPDFYSLDVAPDFTIVNERFTRDGAKYVLTYTVVERNF